MKQLITITGILFILLTQSGCEKRFLDYRNKYVGNYTISTTINSKVDGIITSQNIVYQGKVYYDKNKSEKDKIFIVYDEGKRCETTIDRKGVVTNKYHGGEFLNRKTFKIYFENDPNGSTTHMHGTKN